MVSRNCRTCLLVISCIYLSILLIYSNGVLFRKCLRRIENADTILEFKINIRENGERRTEVIDNEPGGTNIRFISDDKAKSRRIVDDEIRSKEIIFINKKEYDSGIVQLDETKIKQIKAKGIHYERYQNTYDLSLRRRVSVDNVIAQPKTRHTMSSGKRYIFSLRYYEQLSMATKNFLSLASLATYTNRHLVMPFVNNSRFSGLRLGVSMSRFMEASRNNQSNLNGEYKGNKFSNFTTYFDVNHLKNEMKARGYSSLASFHEFQHECTRLNVVIHFLYKDDATTKDLEKWYKVPKAKIANVRRMARMNNGWTECNFVKRSKISKFLGNVNVTRYICVDPEIITRAQYLERTVLQNAPCVGIILWKGNGTKRTHFPLAPSINDPLRPSYLRHSKRLIDIAYSYIRDVIKRPFISVHVRSERHILWRGISATRHCIKKLTKKVATRKATFNLKKIFLASDLEVHGSDTLLSHSNTVDREYLRTELTEGLETPYLFNPKSYNLYDRGDIAIVEMHILSMGESLFTLGAGNFQEWIMDLFLLHNAEDKSLIYKVCELNK